MIERMARFNLGEWGRNLLDYIIENPWAFMIVAFIYGAILLYAKHNYKTFMPNKMKEIIRENPNDSFKVLFTKWEAYKKDLPWYVLVPTKNELWAKPLKKSNGTYQLMLDQDDYFKTEREMMDHYHRVETNKNNPINRRKKSENKKN